MGNDLLTKKQGGVYIFIKDFIQRNGKSPTITEIRDFLKAKSLRTVTQYLEILEKKGFITRNKSKHRSINLAEGHRFETITLPVLASAGCDNRSILAEQKFDEYITVSKDVISDNKNAVVIKAVGNSMQDAGINNEDYVLVEKTEDVKDDDIVIAIIDEVAVVKKISFANNAIILSPVSLDKSYKPIIMNKNFKIFGKVIDVIKNPIDEEIKFIPIEYEK